MKIDQWLNVTFCLVLDIVSFKNEILNLPHAFTNPKVLHVNVCAELRLNIDFSCLLYPVVSLHEDDS